MAELRLNEAGVKFFIEKIEAPFRADREALERIEPLLVETRLLVDAAYADDGPIVEALRLVQDALHPEGEGAEARIRELTETAEDDESRIREQRARLDVLEADLRACRYALDRDREALERIVVADWPEPEETDFDEAQRIARQALHPEGEGK